MTETTNRNRTDCTFEVGDLVLLRFQPYQQQSVQRRSSQKISPRYFGPFRVVRRIGLVAYELDLPPSSRTHRVIHVSQLQRFHGNEPDSDYASLPTNLQQDTTITNNTLTDDNMQQLIQEQQNNTVAESVFTAKIGTDEQPLEASYPSQERIVEKAVSEEEVRGDFSRENTRNVSEERNLEDFMRGTSMLRESRDSAYDPPTFVLPTQVIKTLQTSGPSTPPNSLPKFVSHLSPMPAVHPSQCETVQHPQRLSFVSNTSSESVLGKTPNLMDKVSFGPKSSDRRPKRINKKPNWLKDFY